MRFGLLLMLFFQNPVRVSYILFLFELFFSIDSFSFASFGRFEVILNPAFVVELLSLDVLHICGLFLVVTSNVMNEFRVPVLHRLSANLSGTGDERGHSFCARLRLAS